MSRRQQCVVEPAVSDCTQRFGTAPGATQAEYPSMQEMGLAIMETAATIGAWLKQRRRLRDLTQRTPTARTGYALSTIRKVESGALRPSGTLAERLAEALALAPEERAWLRSHRALPGAADPTPVAEGGARIELRFEFLPPDLQQLAASLVVFADGGTAEAVHASCAPQTDIVAVETNLRALVSAAVLQREFDPALGDAGEQRFWLPVAIRTNLGLVAL